MTRAELRARIRAIRQAPALRPKPTCGACGFQVEPEEWGQRYCKVCEAEISAMIDDARAMDDYQPPAPLTEPFGDGTEPFLPEDTND